MSVFTSKDKLSVEEILERKVIDLEKQLAISEAQKDMYKDLYDHFLKLFIAELRKNKK